MKNFIFGTFIYEYQLIKQDRKTLSLTVTPDLKIILKSPSSADDKKIESFLKGSGFGWRSNCLFSKNIKEIFMKKNIFLAKDIYILVDNIGLSLNAVNKILFRLLKVN